MIDQCSAWAYQEILDSGYIGKRQAQYLHVFTSKYPQPLTHRDASALVNQQFGLRVPERNGRIAELEAMGFIEKFDLIECPFTKKTVNRWRYTLRRSPRLKTMKRVECPHCRGKGIVDIEEYLEL